MTIRDLVARSLRMLRVYGSGVDPEAEESADGLTAFKAMIMAWPAFGVGGPLTEVLITANYTAGEDERVTMSGGTYTVTLPATVVDADTSDNRAPRDGAIVLVAGSAPKVNVYRAQYASWVDLNTITLNDAQPFGPEHDEGLAALLAIRLSPEYGAAITDAVGALAQLGQQQLDARLMPPVRSAVPQELVSSNLSQGYWRQ